MNHKILYTLLSVFALFNTASQNTVYSQDTVIYTKPKWWFGIAGAANLNQYGGSTQKLNNDLMAPVAFHQANSIGLYIAPTVEYYKPNSYFGFMLQAGYDSRRGVFKEELSPCNCPRDLSTNLSYISIEPSLRFAPFKNSLYIYAGPRLAYTLQKSFTYQEKPNPEIAGQVVPADVKANFSDMNMMLVSMQIGAGYDIALSAKAKQTQWILSPFVSFHPYIGQAPRTIETWTVTTLRVGATLKIGKGHVLENYTAKVTPVVVPVITEEMAENSKVVFSVNAPANIPIVRKIREVFPLRNYIFFDNGNTSIPNRYVILKKEDVKDFKEDHLDMFTPKNLSGRSERQLIVYYNVVNILGDRMTKNPMTTIKLVGSNENGIAEATQMSESVKTYLVDVFGINPSRITTEGQLKPNIPSEQPGGTKELELLRDGDRRVSIESSLPVLLMEYQTGPEAPLKPIEIIELQTAPVESYITFTVNDGKNELDQWSIEVKDEAGSIQKFGPYTQEILSMPGKKILGEKPNGDYTVTMVGKTKKGKIVRKEVQVHMVLWTPPVDEEIMRFSIIYEFNNAKAITMYEKYINEVVIPKIADGGSVMIHGYTDIIGNAAYNQKLSMKRAKDVRTILEYGLLKAGKNDVKIEVFGFGEDETLSPFENKFPEERFYNRSVMIDILPNK